MKTERKTAALRRGIAFLCTLVLTLMAVTLPASAANQIEGELNVPGISCTYVSNDGDKGFSLSVENKRGPDYTWNADNKTITGTVKPREYYYKYNKSYSCYQGASSTLTMTNKSEKDCRLTFSYEVSESGKLSFDPADGANNGIYTTTLKKNEAVTVKLTTPTKTEWQKNKPCQEMYTAITTLSGITLKPLDENVSVKLVSASNGSYTAKIGDTALDVPGTYSNPAKTEYTFTSGAAAPNYVFAGWKVNDNVVSTERTYTTAFAADSRVEAVFKPDPMLSVIQLGEGTTGTMTDYIEVNSDYHRPTEGNHPVTEKSWERRAVPGTQDKVDILYVQDPLWSVSGSGITSSANGYAEGDWQKGQGRSQARAQRTSVIIRMRCLEDCTIAFDSSMKITPKPGQWKEDSQDYGVYLYCYTSNNGNVTSRSEFIKGTAVIANTNDKTVKQTKVTVNAGQYLYFYAYGATEKQELVLIGGDFFNPNGTIATMDYTYSATISNVTVTPNNVKHTFTTANEDNTEVVLNGGSVSVNNDKKSVLFGPYEDKLAEGTTMTLKPGDAPTGYTFIGWHNVTDKTYDYTNDTYKVTLTKDYQVNPIYVPAMTITCGTNGYENATYKYKNLSGQMVPLDGQYVARGPILSSGKPNFYTDLGTAFAKESTVFLLAEDIINGDLTIPKDKTLVIPDRLADPGPGNDKPEQYDSTVGIRSYCKVTYSGNLTVNGKLVVNARQSGTASGRASGGIGYLSLSDGATVTVNSGGELCGYGLIRGGSITAKSGSTVRELMEISDRRGGMTMKNICDKSDTYKVFPFSNFSVKTIESRATYETGAKLYAQYSVTLEGNFPSSGAVPLFASSDALFNLTQGSMTKYFDRATDKTVYHLDKGGTMGTGSFSITIKASIVEISINTKDYRMPLNAGFDLRTAGDMTVNGDFKFLPGASLSVEKGGTCTVAKDANLFFYRLNDYDTRKPSTNSHPKSYTSKGYPVSAINLPVEGNYQYQHPTLETVGSARLNVDGDMIVKGGLYVSDELISESNQGYTEMESVNGVPMSREKINKADFKLYSNGYNVLTGTGTIDMTTAQTNQTKVYEAMTASGTNDPTFAPIKITPIAGLKADAEADTQDKYQPLNTQATYYGVYHLGNFYTWTTEKPEIAKIVGGTNDPSAKTYRSLANAVQAYTGEGYIQMLDKSTEPGFTVSKDVILDLNGKTVTLDGTLTVAEGKTLSGMDSSTGTGYDALPKGKIVGTVNGTVAPVFEKTLTGDDEYNYLRYVAIKNEADKEYSFHRFNISVTGYHFELATGDTPQCALFFIGKFRGDDAAKKYLTKLGFTLKYIADESQDFSYPMPESLNNEVGLDEEGAYLFEAYLMRSFDKSDTNAYQAKISATAQAIFGTNVGTQNSETKEWSFQDAWQNALTDSGMDISPAEKEILEKFLKDLNIPIPNPNPKTE